MTQEAIDVLGLDEPLDPAAIDRVVRENDETRNAKWDEIDNRYYESAGDLADPLLAFIKNNRERITLAR